jgi:hypothetical protein
VGSRVHRTKGEKMRRTTIMVALAATMVAVFATAAYAATIAVYGTNDDEWVDESSALLDDRIYALDGDDYINAVLGWSTTNDSDSDKLFGGKGDDDLAADDGDGTDLLNGGPGYDRCWGTPGDRFVNCEYIHEEITTAE